MITPFECISSGAWGTLLLHGRTLVFIRVIRRNARDPVTQLTIVIFCEFRLTKWHSVRRIGEMFTLGRIYGPAVEATNWVTASGPRPYERTFKSLKVATELRHSGGLGDLTTLTDFRPNFKRL